jgi:hypothetical protein
MAAVSCHWEVTTLDLVLSMSTCIYLAPVLTSINIIFITISHVLQHIAVSKC